MVVLKIVFTLVKNFYYICTMKSLKLDRTRLLTVSNYARKSGVTRATVYNWAKSGEVEIVELDGVMFVHE